jgi:hypothetical protein
LRCRTRATRGEWPFFLAQSIASFCVLNAEHVVCVILYYIASFSVRLAGGFIAFPRGQNSGVNCNPRDQLGASRLYFVPSMEVDVLIRGIKADVSAHFQI